MKKSTSTRLVMLAILLCAATTGHSQKTETSWPEEGKFRIDTIYNTKLPYNLFINAGFQGEGDLFSKGAAGFGVYINARYTLARLIQVSGTIVTGAPIASQLGANVANNYDYHNYSARISIPFRKSKEPVNVSKKLYQYYYYEGGNKYQRTYTANFPVMASSYQGITGSISQLHRYYGQKFDSASSFTINDAVSGYRVYTPAYLGYSTLMFSVGFNYSQGIRFKGKAYATLEGLHKRKTVRQKSIVDLAAELLIGATIADDKIVAIRKGDVWSFENADVSKVKLANDVKTNKFGFRFEINMKRGWWGMRFEMGTKPGIRHDYSNGGKVDNEWLVKRMAGGYMIWGLGFGIGALSGSQK